MQQYSVRSPDGVPTLHTSDESSWSGVSPLSQEYPVDGSSHPLTLESCVQPDEGAGGEPLSVDAVHPTEPKTHPKMTRGYRFMVRAAQAREMPAVTWRRTGLIRGSY